MALPVSIVDGHARPFEWWMTSNLALGLVFNCLLPVLLPAYVLAAGGSAVDVWVAMAMAGLLALLGPMIGRFAGRHRAHRATQTLGMLGMTGGLMTLGLSPGDSLSIVLALAMMGIGAAAVTVAAPAYILGTNLPARIQSRQLTWLQLNLDLGKIVGGLLLTAMAADKVSFHAQFWVGGLVMGILGVLVLATSRIASRRISRPEVDLRAASEHSDTVVPWKTLLLSLFGVPVMAQLLGSMTMVEMHISTMLAVSGLVGIGLYFLVGRWMHRSGPALVWAIGHTLRGVGGLAIGVLGLLRGAPYLVILAAFLVLESAPAVAWLAQARPAVRSPAGAMSKAMAATTGSRHSLPVGQQTQREGRRVESVGVVAASPSLPLSQPT